RGQGQMPGRGQGMMPGGMAVNNNTFMMPSMPMGPPAAGSSLGLGAVFGPGAVNQSQRKYMQDIVTGMQNGDINIVANSLSQAVSNK
ncbi:unnamed protein product, partial [Polarella glacialis]